MEDLQKAITELQESGIQIVVMLDGNEDIRSWVFAEGFKDLGLKEVILGKHGWNAPPTFIDGSHPIDAIFVSPMLNCKATGYMGFSESFADHRCLWFDITYEEVFGFAV